VLVWYLTWWPRPGRDLSEPTARLDVRGAAPSVDNTLCSAALAVCVFFEHMLSSAE